MYHFPWQKTSTQMFCHYKAMLWYVTSLTNHRIKEIIWLQPQLYISSDKESATFPTRVLFPSTLLPSALNATQTSRLAFDDKYPSFFPALFTSMPNYRSSISFIVTYRSAILNYLAQCWHVYIITYMEAL